MEIHTRGGNHTSRSDIADKTVSKRPYLVFTLAGLKNRIKRNCWPMQNMWPLMYTICQLLLRIKDQGGYNSFVTLSPETKPLLKTLKREY